MSSYPHPERRPLGDEWADEDLEAAGDDPEIDRLLEELDDLPPDPEVSDEDSRRRP
jgi:hypothetical protein